MIEYGILLTRFEGGKGRKCLDDSHTESLRGQSIIIIYILICITEI